LADKPVGLGQEKRILAGTAAKMIRVARKQVGLTQEKLAQMAGIHRQWLGRWERGRALLTAAQWARLSVILELPACIPSTCQSGYRKVIQQKLLDWIARKV
jgi:DNA-binding XRE family transcriptional regulator